MGKFKFTLSTIWFWLSFVLMTFLTENLAHLTSNPKAGFDFATLLAITIPCLLCLFFFYFVSHKENKTTVDYVLLPSIIIVGGLIIASIWLNQGETIVFADGSTTIDISFSLYERIRATVILVCLLAFLYAAMFTLNVNSPSSRKVHLLALVGVAAGVVSLVFSLCTEMNEYIAIFKGEADYTISIDSFYGNKNYYGGVLLIAFLSCVVANYYKPRFYNYFLIVVFSVAVLATASVLPLLITVCALPIYLFEEVVRFAVKKRWLYAFFATFSILLVLALFALFFVGVTNKWDGFIGLDTYLTDMIKRKDFSTLSGRKQIWKALIPRCFDSPLHSLLGHGFMLSEKSIIGVTAAINNDMAAGVRTTHNGYLQIFYEYGLVGFAVHVALICYFIYACIRLLIEKRFHFVFIYAFVCTCCAIYNMCESSAFFDAGVKELYMTVCFMLPVMTEFKFVNRKNKINEIANIETKANPLAATVLGRFMAVVIMSIIVTAGVSLLSTFTITNDYLPGIMLNIIVGGLITLIFVPYLVYLYRKNTEKPWFIVHCVFNGLSIPSLLIIIHLLFNQRMDTRGLSVVLIPLMLFAILLLESIFYSLFKKGSFREWLSIFVKGSFLAPSIAIFGAILIGGIFTVTFALIGEMNWFIYIMTLLMTMIGFYATWYFFPTKNGKDIISSFNQYGLNRIKTITIKDQTYYG